MDFSENSFERQVADIEHRFSELSEFVSLGEVISDNRLYKHLLSQKKNLEEVASAINVYRKLQTDIEEFEKMLDGESKENRQALTNELEDLNRSLCESKKQIKALLSKSKYLNEESVTIEISSKIDSEQLDGLISMFENYASDQKIRFKKEKLAVGRYNLSLSGLGVYEKFKNFSGHAKIIFRGVETDFTLVVINDDGEDFEFDEKDVEMQTSKSSGAGGQHINKTESAVRLTHVPTGISAECQDERSQTANKLRAMQILKEKVKQKFDSERQKNIENQRKKLKNAVFSTTSNLVLDYDKNQMSLACLKKSYKLSKTLSGGLEEIFCDCGD